MKTVAPLLMLTISALFAFNANLIAQAQITGEIKDKSGNALPYANVVLRKAHDSSFVKGDIAKDDGAFAIQNAALGKYFLEISMVGFANKYSTAFELTPQYQKHNLGTIALSVASELKTVEVTAQKALFEQKIDRFVINVDGSITSAGSTALDVLERSPGVMVNRQDNTISLSGKSGVVVMINGKLTYMTTEAATQMLAGMSANTIEKIELLSTPPSNLDAEGNAGYINIVLKKNQNEGLNGSYAMTAGYGHGAVGNGSFNLNYRHKKWTIYGAYDYTHQAQEPLFHFYRSIELNNKILETEQNVIPRPAFNNNNLRVGFDYQLDKKTTISGGAMAYYNHFESKSESKGRYISNKILDSLITSNIHEANLWTHLGANFTVQHILRKGGTLSFSTDYLHYDNNQPVSYNFGWVDGQNKPLFDLRMRSKKITPIGIAVGKIDYVKEFGTKGKLEMGAKAVRSKFKNDVGVESLISNDWVTYAEFTANYDLKESIGAAYMSYEMKWGKKTNVKGGIRYEYTQSNLGSVEQANIVDRKYGQFFPSLFVSHNFDKNNTLGLSYSRRITRPTFNQLAPFTVFVDLNTFFSGNPALQPAISDNLKADYKFKSTLFTFQYSYQAHPIARFQPRIIAGTNKVYNLAENQKSLQTYSLTIGIPYSPMKWWTTYTNLAGLLNQVEGYYNGQLITVKFPNMMLYNTQTFSLPKKWTLELSGTYLSGGLFGLSKVKAFGAANIGLQKKMEKNGGKLSFGYDDIFNTSIYRVNLAVPEQKQYISSRVQFTRPKFKVSWSQNFGNQKMKAATKRADAEEKGRVE